MQIHDLFPKPAMFLNHCISLKNYINLRFVSLNSSLIFFSHKYEKADYLKRLFFSVIIQFQDRSNQSNINDFNDYIIPPNSFDIPKSFILIELPFFKTMK